jgi:hypothetical protein
LGRGGVKREIVEAEHSPPSDYEIKNRRLYTYIEIINRNNEIRKKKKKKKVQSIRYLGSGVNLNNEIEEVTERINAGNKAFYTNKKMFQCKLLSKRPKLRLYWLAIRPVVTLVKHGVLEGNSAEVNEVRKEDLEKHLRTY